MFCNNCGHAIDKTASNCPNCGIQLTIMTNSQNETDSQVATEISGSSKVITKYPVPTTPTERASSGFKQRNLFMYIIPLYICVGVLLAGLLFGYSLFSEEEFSDFLIKNWIILLVIILCIFVSSLTYMYYIYLNFRDMSSLHMHTHGDMVFPRPMEPLYAIFFFLSFSAVTYFAKYDYLFKHLTRIHGLEEKRTTSPWTYLIFIICISIVFPVIFIIFQIAYEIGTVSLFTIVLTAVIGMAIVMIFTYYMEHKWQNALNEHIQSHYT